MQVLFGWKMNDMLEEEECKASSENGVWFLFNPDWHIPPEANNDPARGTLSYVDKECIPATQKVAAVTGVCELAHTDQKEWVRMCLRGFSAMDHFCDPGHTPRIFFEKQNPKKPKQHL